MELSRINKTQLVLFVMLLVNIIDARHLTNIKSDADTRRTKSLVVGGVRFLGKPTRSPTVKVAPVEDVKPTQLQEDGSVRTLVKVNQKDQQHLDVNQITELKEVESIVKEQQAEEIESSNDNDIVQGDNRNDFFGVDNHDKFPENRSSDLDPKNDNLTSENGRNNEFEHRVEHPDTDGIYTDKRASDADTVSSLTEYDKTEIDTDAKHNIDQNTQKHTPVVSADSAIHSTNEKMLTNGKDVESDSTAVNEKLSNQQEFGWNNHATVTHHSEKTGTETMGYPRETLQSTQQTHMVTEDDVSDLAPAQKIQIKDTDTLPQWKTPSEAGTHDSRERNNGELDSHKGDVTVKDHHSDIYKPKVTVFVEEKNDINGHTHRILASNGEGVVQSHRELGAPSNLVKAQIVLDDQQAVEESQTPATTTTFRPESTTEVNNQNVKQDGSTSVTPTELKTIQAKWTPQDVEPLDIFTNDIKYQRFPRPMSYTTLKNKVLDKPLKKLYILEESKKKLFQHVRQLEAVYTVEDGVLYVSFLFRFVFSRKCQEIQKFKLGNLVGNTDLAIFEKELKDGRTERIMFFSERPEDYVFFMSCTDMKNSPYACRDSYYVTLDSVHDPPNQFPWGDAARELESKMNLTFEDPRFVFNFVLLPCARGRVSV